MHAGVKGEAPQSFLLTHEEGDKESVPMCDGGGTMTFQRKVELPEPTARGMSPERKPAEGDEGAGDVRVEESS